MRTPDDRQEIFRGFIARTRVSYQVSRPLSSRLVVEYDEFDRRFRVEPLLTYRRNAFTVVYLGMADQYQEYKRPAEAGSDPLAQGDPFWKLDAQQVFAKVQYLFRI